MRCALILLAVASCDDAGGPPTLPGAQDPDCELDAPSSYLVRTLAPYPARGFDLSYPPDGETDTDSVPYRFFHAAAPMLLDDSLQQAFDDHRLLWVITVQRCHDGSSARASIRAAAGFSANRVTLAADPFTWSVGTFEGKQLEVAEGIGWAPFAAPVDARANEQAAKWFPAYMVALSAELDGDSLSGAVGLAVSVAESTPAVSEAIARTLTVMKQLEPSCPSTCSTPELGVLMRAFDTNGDQQFSADEVQQSGWLSMLGFMPDLDLLADLGDGALTFWPGHDHHAEAYAHAYGFTASLVMVE